MNEKKKESVRDTLTLWADSHQSPRDLSMAEAMIGLRSQSLKSLSNTKETILTQFH